MARPKGSGRGLVAVSVRLEPEIAAALTEWRTQQPNGELSEAEALRQLVRWALENVAGLDKRQPAEALRAEALRRARGDLHRALNQAWEKIT